MITFLFGAGTSIPAGMENIDKITKIILNSPNVVKPFSIYLTMEPPFDDLYEFNRKYVTRVRMLLEILRDKFKGYYQQITYNQSYEMNYEDYYFLVNMMHENEIGNYNNAMVDHFIQEIKITNKDLFEPIDKRLGKVTLKELVSQACNMIEDIVREALQKSPNTLEHLAFLKYAFEDESLKYLNIFTLNHDTIFEQYFRNNNIPYDDGFSIVDGGIKQWNMNYLSQKIRLYKLHGSIDWIVEHGVDYYDYKLNIYPPEMVYSGDRPKILIGTFNKLNEYTRGELFELQCKFWNVLESTNYLVVSGYSFRDQGINTKILNWLFKSNDRKILLIDPNLRQVVANSRMAFKSKWNYLEGKAKVLKAINKGIQDMSWSDIKKELHSF